MELERHSLPASTRLYGEQNEIVAAAGKTLRIETTPGGDEILEAIVPAGKQWVIKCSVSIDETDA